MNGDLERPQHHYYRLALVAARRRDLSAAALYARYALALNADHEGAAKLLALCLDDLGEAGGGYALSGYAVGEYASGNAADGLAKVRELAGQKKWRAAEKAAQALPRRSVRILNIRGCLLAAAKRYAQAAECFAEALAMDRGNTLAAKGFAETAPRRNFPSRSIVGRGMT
jgi:tetratricopeptide (TPR) repeat protein